MKQHLSPLPISKCWLVSADLTAALIQRSPFYNEQLHCNYCGFLLRKARRRKAESVAGFKCHKKPSGGRVGGWWRLLFPSPET